MPTGRPRHETLPPVSHNLKQGLRHARQDTLTYKGYTLTSKGRGYDVSLDGVKLNKNPVPKRAVASYVATRLSSGTRSLVGDMLTKMSVVS